MNWPYIFESTIGTATMSRIKLIFSENIRMPNHTWSKKIRYTDYCNFGIVKNSVLLLKQMLTMLYEKKTYIISFLGNKKIIYVWTNIGFYTHLLRIMLIKKWKVLKTTHSFHKYIWIIINNFMLNFNASWWLLERLIVYVKVLIMRHYFGLLNVWGKWWKCSWTNLLIF